MIDRHGGVLDTCLLDELQQTENPFYLVFSFVSVFRWCHGQRTYFG